MSSPSPTTQPTFGPIRGAWAPGPSDWLLAERTLDVWRVELETVNGELADLLCAQERERAERFLGKRDGELWRRSRGVLRALLGRYLQRDPQTLRFDTGAHGKPVLREDAVGSPATPASQSGRSPRISFNVSHSGGLALYAFSRSGAVGVDVELARRPVNAVALAARIFGPEQAERLEGLDPAHRQREFRRTWVRHEAMLKCRGTGFGGFREQNGQAQQRPWIHELDLGPQAAGAVAAQEPPVQLRCWEWPAQPTVS